MRGYHRGPRFRARRARPAVQPGLGHEALTPVSRARNSREQGPDSGEQRRRRLDGRREWAAARTAGRRGEVANMTFTSVNEYDIDVSE